MKNYRRLGIPYQFRDMVFQKEIFAKQEGYTEAAFQFARFYLKNRYQKMRQALQDKKNQDTESLKLEKIDIYYQNLHDAFYKWQTKPRLTIQGDLYYEGNMFETRLKEKKPGELSDELRTVLGMPFSPNTHKVLQPWCNDTGYEPQPSFPNLKTPGWIEHTHSRQLFVRLLCRRLGETTY